MKFIIPILFLFISTQIASCGRILGALATLPQRSIVYKDSKSKLDYLVIKSITNTPCYYYDVYAEKYENGHKTYQFSYGCSKFTTPGKITYEYDVNGNVINTTKYSFADSFKDTVSLNQTDLLVIYLIDSVRSKQLSDYPDCRICTKTITALRLLNE